MQYDVKAKCKHCGKIFVLHEGLFFEYPDDPDFEMPTKKELEELNFVDKSIGKSAYCDDCRQIGGLIKKVFFVPFTDIDDAFFSAITIKNCDIPEKKGVYLIVDNIKKRKAKFVYPSPAGWFRGKNPSVEETKLKEKWVDGADILYIGKSNNLQRRMKQHINFWSGKATGAWGGRIIAQISGYENFQVWYMECDDPAQKESELIDLFKEHYGRLPFANWKKGNKKHD